MVQLTKKRRPFGMSLFLMLGLFWILLDEFYLYGFASLFLRISFWSKPRAESALTVLSS